MMLQLTGKGAHLLTFSHTLAATCMLSQEEYQSALNSLTAMRAQHAEWEQQLRTMSSNTADDLRQQVQSEK